MFTRVLAVAGGLVCAAALAAPAAVAAEPAKDPKPPNAAAVEALADAIVRAEKRVKQARADLIDAQKTAARLRGEAGVAEAAASKARTDLGNFAREAYRGGPVDLLGIASLFDTPNPSDTIRRATVVELLVQHQDSQVAEALAAVGQVNVLREQADTLVQQAKRQVTAAESALKAIKGNRDLLGELDQNGSGGTGTAEVTKRCLEAEVVVDLCTQPPWSEQNLTFDAVLIERFVHVQWPQIEVVGGWRPSDPYPDHPSGRAVDIMMPNSGTTRADVALGDDIAAYFQEHAAEYGIYYMIWRQQIWKASDPVGQWTAMSDRGSPTANHMDHVHISVTNGNSGTAWELALLRSDEMKKLIGKDGRKR